MMARMGQPDDRMPPATDVRTPPPRAARVLVRVADAYRRLLGVTLSVLGPRAAYALTGALARLLYRLMTPLRVQSETHCRAALLHSVPPEEVPRIAAAAFVHRVWDLTDLMLADRWLRPGTLPRYGGGVPEPHRASLQADQAAGRPVILVTAYYGPFDLLPLLLGYSGLRATVVYKPHANAGYDAWRRAVRGRSGCELVTVAEAAIRLPQVLEQGGTVAIVADHHAERRGLPATFLGLPTQAWRTVGLLAAKYEAAVAVAGVRRLGRRFRFEIDVVDTIRPRDWSDAADAVALITHRYLRGLERLILADPTQYLWGYPRWGRAFSEELLEQELARSSPPTGRP